MTIYDVAREAGVAPSTVSRAFSRPGRVNATTAQRIREVAEQLGYRTNPLARALSTARSRMIGVVVSDIANPFYAEIIRGAQTVAAREGFTILLADAQESKRLERAAIDRALPSIDGVLLASSRLSDSAIRMVSKQKPLVVLNRAVVDVPCVVTDNGRGAHDAVTHLRDLGHEHITYVAGPAASWADAIRWRAVRETAHELGLRARRIGPFPPDVQGGVRAGEALRASPTSAVIAYNDQIAIGLIGHLSARQVRVPHDVSVVGFDNIFAGRLITPAVTTVAAPLHAAGATATKHLLAVINGSVGNSRALRVSAGQCIGHPIVLPVHLVVRGSTARSNDQRSRKRTSPASGTTSVWPSVARAGTSTVSGPR